MCSTGLRFSSHFLIPSFPSSAQGGGSLGALVKKAFIKFGKPDPPQGRSSQNNPLRVFQSPCLPFPPGLSGIAQGSNCGDWGFAKRTRGLGKREGPA